MKKRNIIVAYLVIAAIVFVAPAFTPTPATAEEIVDARIIFEMMVGAGGFFTFVFFVMSAAVIQECYHDTHKETKAYYFEVLGFVADIMDVIGTSYCLFMGYVLMMGMLVAPLMCLVYSSAFEIIF